MGKFGCVNEFGLILPSLYGLCFVGTLVFYSIAKKTMEVFLLLFYSYKNGKLNLSKLEPTNLFDKNELFQLIS